MVNVSIRITTYLLLALLPSAGNARADILANGEGLLQACEAFQKDVRVESNGLYMPTNNPEVFECRAFIGAIQQYTRIVATGAHTAMINVCPPNDSNLSQLIRVIVSYGHRHPEKLHLPSGNFAFLALDDAFPCK